MKAKNWSQENAELRGQAQAKLRGLEHLDVPYLRASGEGFAAYKRGKFRELRLSADSAQQTVPPTLATNDLVTNDLGLGWVGYVADKAGRRFRRKGVYGRFSGKAAGTYLILPEAHLQVQSLSCPTYIHSPTGQDPVTVNRRFVVAPHPSTLPSGQPPFGTRLAVIVNSWARFFAQRRAVADDGYQLGRNSVNAQAVVRGKNFHTSELDSMIEALTPWASRLGWHPSKGLCVGVPHGEIASGVMDDYGFSVVRPRLLLSFFGKRSSYTLPIVLPLPNDTTAVHSYAVGNPVAVAPGTFMLLVAEHFQPQRFRYEPGVNDANPRSRLLVYTMYDWGEGEIKIREVVLPAGLIFPDPAPAYGSAASVTNAESQPVAWNAKLYYDAASNCQLNGLLNANGVSVGEDRVLWFAPIWKEVPDPYIPSFGYEHYAMHALVINSEGEVVHHNELDAPTSLHTLPWADPVYLDRDTVLVRVRQYSYQVRSVDTGNLFPKSLNVPVSFFISTNNGATFEAFVPAGLPSMLNERIGIPTVSKVEEGSARELFLPMRETVEGQEIVALWVSHDRGATWQRKGKMLDFPADATFVPPIHTWGGAMPAYEIWMGGGLLHDAKFAEADVQGLGRVVVVVDHKKKLAPLDPVRPWVYDASYEVPKP